MEQLLIKKHIENQYENDEYQDEIDILCKV
jgi:hypothetical protein